MAYLCASQLLIDPETQIQIFTNPVQATECGSRQLLTKKRVIIINSSGLRFRFEDRLLKATVQSKSVQLQ